MLHGRSTQAIILRIRSRVLQPFLLPWVSCFLLFCLFVFGICVRACVCVFTLCLQGSSGGGGEGRVSSKSAPKEEEAKIWVAEDKVSTPREVRSLNPGRPRQKKHNIPPFLEVVRWGSNSILHVGTIMTLLRNLTVTLRARGIKVGERGGRDAPLCGCVCVFLVVAFSFSINKVPSAEKRKITA